jgi:nitroreductase
MSVAIYALGFASIWRSGPVAYDPRVKAALGLKETDAIVGYLYVGTPTTRERQAPVLNTSDYVEHWK